MRAACLLVALAACGGPASTAIVPTSAPAPDPRIVARVAADVAWLTAPERRGRGSRSPEAIATAHWLVDELAAAGYAPTTQPIATVTGQLNVIATWQPATMTATTPTLLVCAHYDHLGVIDGEIYPGADDNASGVAAVLAVARALPATPIAARVIFLFTGAEELGLDGAHAYVNAPTVPLSQLRAMVNLDMVGHGLYRRPDDTTLSLMQPDDPVIDAATTTAARLADLPLLPYQPTYVEAAHETHRSDDWVFRDRGVLALFLSSGMHADYHLPTDVAANVSPAQIVRAATFVQRLLEQLAGVFARPPA